MLIKLQSFSHFSMFYKVMLEVMKKKISGKMKANRMLSMFSKLQFHQVHPPIALPSVCNRGLALQKKYFWQLLRGKNQAIKAVAYNLQDLGSTTVFCAVNKEGVSWT